MIIPASRFQFGKIEIPTLWNNVKTIEFHKAIRAFHSFKKFWKPHVNEKLDCFAQGR